MTSIVQANFAAQSKVCCPLSCAFVPHPSVAQAWLVCRTSLAVMVLVDVGGLSIYIRTNSDAQDCCSVLLPRLVIPTATQSAVCNAASADVPSVGTPAIIPIASNMLVQLLLYLPVQLLLHSFSVLLWCAMSILRRKSTSSSKWCLMRSPMALLRDIVCWAAATDSSPWQQVVMKAMHKSSWQQHHGSSPWQWHLASTPGSNHGVQLIAAFACSSH